MSHVAHVEEQYLPYRSAAVHIEDRGYQFAEGLRELYLAYAAAAA